MTPIYPQPQAIFAPLSFELPVLTASSTTLATPQFFVKTTHELPRFNAAYAVVFVRDGARKRRELAYSRARDLQRELGVSPGLQCVPSLP